MQERTHGNTSAAIENIDRESIKTDVPEFSVGDSVRVHARIYEGDKERIQVFAGTVIARDGKGPTETFTVRRISYGIGVEKVFPVHSPHVAKLEIKQSNHVRRAKLYFLRRKTGKQSRLKAKRSR